MPLHVEVHIAFKGKFDADMDEYRTEMKRLLIKSSTTILTTLKPRAVSLSSIALSKIS